MNKDDVRKIWCKNSAVEREYLLNELNTTGEAWNNLLQKKITPAPGNKVLDIGCGTGFLSLLFAQIGFQVTAIDISGAMIDEAKAIAKIYAVDENIDFIQMDVDELDFAEGQFDIIASRYAFWLFEKPEIVYKKCYRLLKRGGVLLNFDSDWLLPLRDEDCKKRFLKDEQELIQRFGEFEDFYHNAEVMAVFNSLPLSAKKRPDWDEKICLKIGFINVEQEAYQESNLRDDFFALRYKEMPVFLIKAEK